MSFKTGHSATLERLKKVGPMQFVRYNLLSCVVAGSILFLLVHFVGSLITPVGTAVVLVIVIVLPLAYTVIHPRKLQFLEPVLSAISFLMSGANMMDLQCAFRDAAVPPGSTVRKRVWEGFNKSIYRFFGPSNLAKLLMLIVSTTLVELFWPGYFHNLLVTAAIAIPSSVLDALLFQRIVYPIVQREMEQ